MSVCYIKNKTCTTSKNVICTILNNIKVAQGESGRVRGSQGGSGGGFQVVTFKKSKYEATNRGGVGAWFAAVVQLGFYGRHFHLGT